MMIKVSQGNTAYYVTFDADGAVQGISGVAVIGKTPPQGGRGRRVAWGGGIWHSNDRKPIPRRFVPVVEAAVKRREAALSEPISRYPFTEATRHEVGVLAMAEADRRSMEFGTRFEVRRYNENGEQGVGIVPACLPREGARP